MPRDLPAGTVTFLFSDVEGSTTLLHELGAESYGRLLMEHRGVMRAVFAKNGGVEVDTQGDAFFAAFPTARGAAAAAREIRDTFAPGRIHVRIGLHTGTPHLTDDGYVGEDVHLGARIASAGHGGQILLSAATSAAIAASDAVDLGEHRLKDFAEPVAIFQLGNGQFPPLKTISNTNLPHPASSFVGREREVAEIASLVRNGARLVTLTGPGGTGKTRLAIETASELVGEFRAGVFWVDLSSVREARLVPDTIAQTLGAKGTLAGHIGERPMLLVVDNLEQVIDAAPDLSTLLAACSGLQMIVTSRELLRIRGEVEYAVPPLAGREAVTLFVTRANMTEDPAVERICARLDDLPLAIELAAARARVLTPAQILARLDQRLPLLTTGARDVSERQRTLRGTIAWSYELLDAEERRLFAHLAVFNGGWTLEAAEAIAHADLDVLQSLVEKSLVRHEGDRFAMLETIRDYARERLDATDESDVLAVRHAEFFLALAEREEAATISGDPGETLDSLERVHDNLRAAMERFKATGENERAMRLGAALYEFWCLRGYAREGFRRLEDVLAQDQRGTEARAKALLASAHLAPKAGASESLQAERTRQALELNRTLGRGLAVAQAQHELAGELIGSGEIHAAITLLEEAIRGFRAVGEQHLDLVAMRTLAWAWDHLGERRKYTEIVTEVLRLARQRGSKRMEFTALGALAWVATDDRRFSDALSLLAESASIDRASLPRSDVSLLLTRLALVHAESGRLESAAALVARAHLVNEETGDVDAEWVAEFKRRVGRIETRGDDATQVSEQTARGRALSIDGAVELGLAPLSQLQGEPAG